MLEIDISVKEEELPDLSAGQISKLARSIASRVRDAVIQATPIGDRENAGATRRSWTPVRRVEGGYSFGSSLPQSIPLEYGSGIGKRPWPSVPEKKPRTVYNHGRVFSSQAPEGITNKADIDNLAATVAEVLFKKMVKGQSIAKR